MNGKSTESLRAVLRGHGFTVTKLSVQITFSFHWCLRSRLLSC